jgi:hypothetical protein
MHEQNIIYVRFDHKVRLDAARELREQAVERYERRRRSGLILRYVGGIVMLPFSLARLGCETLSRVVGR